MVNIKGIIFVVIALGLVIYAVLALPIEDSMLFAIIPDVTPVNWDEVKKRNTVISAIPITTIQEVNGKCKVDVKGLTSILDHEFFVKSDQLASELNFDRAEDTITVACSELHGEKSKLHVWYVVENAPKHSTKYQYWITEWSETPSDAALNPRDFTPPE